MSSKRILVGEFYLTNLWMNAYKEIMDARSLYYIQNCSVDTRLPFKKGKRIKHKRKHK